MLRPFGTGTLCRIMASSLVPALLLADVDYLGAAAAQVVPHVHYHIIPRPALTPELRNKSFTMFGRGQRSEIDDDEAAELAGKLRAEVSKEMSRLHKAKL